MNTNNPLSNSTFRKLFTAQIIALVGTGLSTIGLSLLAYDMAGSNAGAVLGIALACKMIAYIVFSPIIAAQSRELASTKLLLLLTSNKQHTVKANLSLACIIKSIGISKAGQVQFKI